MRRCHFTRTSYSATRLANGPMLLHVENVSMCKGPLRWAGDRCTCSAPLHYETADKCSSDPLFQCVDEAHARTQPRKSLAGYLRSNVLVESFCTCTHVRQTRPRDLSRCCSRCCSAWGGGGRKMQCRSTRLPKERSIRRKLLHLHSFCQTHMHLHSLRREAIK